MPRTSSVPAPGPGVAPSWRPNLTWITEHLAVGGRFPAERAEHLAREERVGAVIDLRSEDCDDETLLERHGIAFLHLPTDDHGAISLPMIADGVAFARAHLARGERVLVHCEHGIGRSATLALCIMVESDYAPLEALALAKDRRALVSPSPAQFECWTRWMEKVQRTGQVAWELPSFEAFKAIAYRHLGQG